MLINSIAIKNFRCIKDLEVEIAELTAFVGRNGSGKSTLLQSLNTFYNIKASISEEDFFDGDTDNPIEITVEFKNLSEEESTEFGRYVNDDKFAVSKRIEFNDGSISQKYYASTRQIPEIATIRNGKNVTAKRKAWNELVENNLLPDIGPKSVRGDDPEMLMSNYESSKPKLAQWIPEQVQFLGPPNIGGGKLDNYTKFVYVPAVRDASDDTTEKKGTPLQQLLDFIVMRRFHSRPEVRQLKEEFSEKLSDLYDNSKLTEFGDLADEISDTLRLYVPNAQLDLIVTEPKLPEIPSPSTIANLIEDDYAGSINRKGHGLQRALIFSLLQHLAIAQPFEDEESTDANNEDLLGEGSGASIKSDQIGPALIIAIEEPELYQHPLRARHLARTLLNMSQESTLGPGGRNQILYSTHSPYFVDLGRFDQLRIMRKYRQDPAEPACTSVSSFTLHQASQVMAQLTGSPKETFTAQSFRARAHPVMTQSVSEGFFADAVVLVEGSTEVAALLTLSYQLGFDWLSSGIAVVPVEGKTKINTATVVFKGLGIPTYIVFDGDNKCQGKGNEEDTAKINRLLLRSCGALEENFPASVAAANYACFTNDFESYCREVIGKEKYELFREQATHMHGYTRPSKGIKNYEVVESLVTLVYDNGHSLELVEQIVERVNEKLCFAPANVDDAKVVAADEK